MKSKKITCDGCGSTEFEIEERLSIIAKCSLEYLNKYNIDYVAVCKVCGLKKELKEKQGFYEDLKAEFKEIIPEIYEKMENYFAER